MTAAFLGELYATMSVNTADLDRAAMRMKRFEQETNKSLRNVSRSFQTAGSAMKTFGRQMTQYVTVPMALVGGASLKMYRDFEFSMNKVVSLVGVARTQVDAWTKQVLALAPAVGKSPKELADAMYFITSAGIRGKEALEILEESAKSSASGLGEVKVVADLLTSAMNAYGKENLSAAQANDILTATVREGKAEADLIGTHQRSSVDWNLVGCSSCFVRRQATQPSIVETKTPESVMAMPSSTGGAGSAHAALFEPSSREATQKVPGPWLAAFSVSDSPPATSRASRVSTIDLATKGSCVVHLIWRFLFSSLVALGAGSRTSAKSL